tara:strand:- start:605 stop:802 length:198 start_codon:yes stop_codon:yes gene_type:complete
MLKTFLGKELIGKNGQVDINTLEDQEVIGMVKERWIQSINLEYRLRISQPICAKLRIYRPIHAEL